MTSRELEMVCTCQLDGVHEVEARRHRIFDLMRLDDTSDLTPSIVMSLVFDFQASANIYADQWFGVYVSSPLCGDLSVQCDWPADGLAAIWEHLATAFPDRVTINPSPSERRVRVAKRCSAALVAQYETAEAAYRGHRSTSHTGNNDCPPCEDCSVFLTLAITSHQTLNESWGDEVLDKAIERSFEA